MAEQMRSDGLLGLGVFLTPEEVAEVRSRIGRPAIALQCGPIESAQEAVHRLALAHGLPEVIGFYGCDLDTRELVRVP